MLNRQREALGLPRINHKPIYRLSRRHGLLLERHSGRRPGRVHDGKIVVMRSNLRWCSDAFEIACWNGSTVRVGFVLDAHDREAIAWVAVAGRGLGGSDVRDLMLDAVEKRFGTERAASDRMALRQRLALHGSRDPRLRRPAQPRAR